MRGFRNKAKIVVPLALVIIAACSDADLNQQPGGGETRSDGGPAGGKDGGGGEGGQGEGGAAIKPSGCPSPATVAPDELPSGFLPAQKVTLVRTVDGDTAHFMFESGEQTVRFLYVNTEETHDAEATQFGLDAAAKVKQYLEGAGEIQVAPEEDTKKPGSPHLDTFGRTLALIFVDGDLFETRMIRDGLTPYYTQFGCANEPVHDALLWAEAEARANERGVWAPDHPTDYSIVLKEWIGSRTCRPNPYKAAYCK